MSQVLRCHREKIASYTTPGTAGTPIRDGLSMPSPRQSVLQMSSESRENKQRIIPETVRSARRVQNDSLSRTPKGRQCFSIASDRQHTDEPDRSFSGVTPYELVQNASVVGVIVGVVSARCGSSAAYRAECTPGAPYSASTSSPESSASTISPGTARLYSRAFLLCVLLEGCPSSTGVGTRRCLGCRQSQCRAPAPPQRNHGAFLDSKWQSEHAASIKPQNVILSEAKDPCNLADASRLHRSFASLRMTTQEPHTRASVASVRAVELRRSAVGQRNKNRSNAPENPEITAPASGPRSE